MERPVRTVAYNTQTRQRRSIADGGHVAPSLVDGVAYYDGPSRSGSDVFSLDLQVPDSIPRRWTSHGHVGDVDAGVGGPCWSQFNMEIWCQPTGGEPLRIFRQRFQGRLEVGNGFVVWQTDDGDLVAASVAETDGVPLMLMPRARGDGPELSGFGFAVDGDRVVWASGPQHEKTGSASLHVALLTK